MKVEIEVDDAIKIFELAEVAKQNSAIAVASLKIYEALRFYAYGGNDDGETARQALEEVRLKFIEIDPAIDNGKSWVE